MKSKELTLEELVKEINLKGKEYLSIEVLFDLLFKISTLYIDYYESDLGEYLTNKSSKKYYLYISSRIIVILGYLTTLSLFTFLKTSSLSIVFGVIALLIYIVFIYVDVIINQKYKYTTAFFQSTRKKLILFNNKINLLLNNSYLSERYTSANYEFEMIKSDSTKLKNRIETINEIIKPYSYYLKKFALPPILFASVITFFINLIYDRIQNPILFNLDVIIDILLGLSFLILIIYQHLRWIIRAKKSRKIKETSIYSFYGIMIRSILEALRLRLRMIQFPIEEEIKVALRIASKKILEGLNKDSF